MEWGQSLQEERDACIEDSHLIAEELIGIKREASFQKYIDHLRAKGGKLDIPPTLNDIKLVLQRKVKASKSPSTQPEKNEQSSKKVKKDTPATEVERKQAEQQTIVDAEELDIPDSDSDAEGDDAEALALVSLAGITVEGDDDELAALESINVA